jgi:TolA-binding protein
MNRFQAPLLAMRLGLAGAIAFTAMPPTTVLAQAGLDQQDMDKAAALADQGKFVEAGDLYEGIEQKYPTSPLIPQATLRLGYVFFRQGEWDKAAERLQKVQTLKNATPEAIELALSLVPQVLSAKAGSMPENAPARKAAFEDAIKQFDVFLSRYPQSAEFETANYGKAVALYQVAKYDEAIKALSINAQRFPNSEQALDTRYLLALTMGTVANVNSQKATAKDPTIDAYYKQAEQNLDYISRGSDVALANDARFQTGELLFVRAGLIKDADHKKEEAERKAMYQRALEAYRIVQPKEYVIQAQKAKIEAYKAKRQEYLRAANLDMANKRMPRLIDREQEKLATIEQKPDQTLSARLKMAQVFFRMDRPDECRVILEWAKPIVQEPQQKTDVSYYTAVSLAKQNSDTHGHNKALADRAEAAYADFRKEHKGDPLGENLAALLGAGFVDTDPNKAIKYFKESSADYPKGHVRMFALAQEAAALVRLERYDDALKTYKDTLAAKPDREVAASAEYGIATVYQKTGKIKESLATYKAVRDKYKGLEQAEQAAFWYGQLLDMSGNPKDGLTELTAFIKDYPKSQLIPSAYYYEADAQAKIGQRDAALATYKKLGEDFPKADVAAFSYLQRGQLLMAAQKFDETIAVMKELIKAYPDGKELFQAYDLIAQIYGSQQKVPEQIATYEEYIKSKPNDPNAAQALSKVAGLWKDQANRLGRFVALNKDQQEEWKKDTDASMDASVRLVTSYPDNEAVALGLKTLLDVQKMRQNARLLTDEEIEKYFQELGDKFKEHPGTRSKILFTLASHVFEKDKAKADKIMASAYDPKQKYAPADLDLYGTSLIEQKKYEEAKAVYDKLAKDYPLPPGAVANGKVNAPQDIQEAQAIVLFGRGKILQEQKKEAEAGALFSELEKLYGWSPKNLEGSYGIALADYQKKKYDECLKRLLVIIKASTAPAELRAKAMLLLARCHEDQGHFEAAIDNYLKIPNYYSAVASAASEGLWRGANLLERQARGEIPMPTPTPKPAGKAPAKAAPKK